MKNTEETKIKVMLASCMLVLLAMAALHPFSRRRGADDWGGGTALRVASLNGPSSVVLAYLYEHAPNLDGADISFQLYASPVMELPKLLQGEADIGFLPPNQAAKVYNSSGESLVVLGISGMGNLYLLSDDPSLDFLAGLEGKTVHVAGQGATPEYIFRYLTDGIAVECDYSLPTAQLAQALASGKIHYALVPEPFATLAVEKSPSVRRSLDIQRLYAERLGGGYPMTLMVCREEFATTNPDLIRSFLAAYKEATAWTLAHPAEAGVLVEKHTLGLNAAAAAAAIPNGGYVWIPAQEGKGAVEQLLGLFLGFAPDSIGGRLPGSGFYY